MKKSSASLFAVLAIVVAISSAFTTSSKGKQPFFARYQIWGMEENISTNYISFPYSTNEYGFLENSTKFVLADNWSPFSYLGGSTFMDELINIHESQLYDYTPDGTTFILCYTNSQRICLAYVDTNGQNILAVLQGEYDAIWEEF